MSVILPKPWVATFLFPPITSALLNKMCYFCLSVSFPYPFNLASTGELQRLFLHCIQCFTPYLWYIYVGFFFLGFFNSEML